MSVRGESLIQSVRFKGSFFWNWDVNLGVGYYTPFTGALQ